LKGVQFYVNLNARETDSRYYRWRIEETWEFHSQYPREFYYNGEVNQVIPPDYSRMICWRTLQFNDFFLLSTQNLSENKYAKHPLHFDDNKTTKLYIGCSEFVKQFAISEQAYYYWEQLRTNSRELGGNLYEKQPLPVQGNLHNVTHPERRVLGYFESATLSTRRIFVDAQRDIGIYYDETCAPQLKVRGWRQETSPAEYPVNFINRDGRIYFLEPGCVDCTKLHGVLEKPEFWPK
jgi:hypothetical protein